MAGSFSHLFIKIRIHKVIATQAPCTQCNLLFYYLKYVAAIAFQKYALELF